MNETGKVILVLSLTEVPTTPLLLCLGSVVD